LTSNLTMTFKDFLTCLTSHNFKFCILLKKLFLISGIAFFFFTPGRAAAQEKNDTIKAAAPADTIAHSPKKAALYSAFLPGLGQVYNKKYWKVPIIYAGIGGLGYFIGSAQSELNSRRNELVYRVNNRGERNNREFFYYDDQQLISTADEFRKMRDMLVIGTFGFYLLQIIDASVDAHLFTFDVSEDLSLNIQPDLKYCAWSGQANPGLSLRIKF
jgi:hypothetical protein